MLACEQEPGLGNGGLGRLAACYLESLATLQRPAIGYGIRYEFGTDQEIHDGRQVETTDNWLAEATRGRSPSPNWNYQVKWGGYTERQFSTSRALSGSSGIPQRSVKGVYYGSPIQGYGVNTCNTLTLWSARAMKELARCVQRRRLLPRGRGRGGLRDRH